MTNDTRSRQERVDELIADFLQQIEAGIPVTPEQWLNLHSDYHTELADFFANHQQLERLAAPLRSATDAISQLEPDRRLGDFLIRGEIGRGGMGVVYEADQVSLGRRVALKVLPFAAMLDEHQLRRFKNEAHAAAVLQHPNIVSVFYVGCERGVHFYAMPLIDGSSLAELLHHVRQDANEGEANRVDHAAETVRNAALETVLSTPGIERSRYIAELGKQAAEALAYAHREGIIHRDIKPSNLLVDFNRKLWITDFGLARVLDSGDRTPTGSVVGTLRYMSPEQLIGGQVVDHRADIYSLGLTLYELLAQRPAFSGTEREFLVRSIQEDEPTPLQRIDPAIPFDLTVIVERATAKEREHRYANAQDLADDLQRFLEHRPIHARPTGRVERLWRWYRRSPAVAMLSLVVLLMSLVIAGSAVLLAGREVKQRKQADTRTEEAEWQQYLSDMQSAMAAWEQSNVGRTLELLERHRPQVGEPDLRGFEWNYLSRQCQDKRLKLTIDETTNVRGGVSFSHDGRMLATGNDDGLVRVWDPSIGWLIHEFKHPTIICRVAFSPDDRILASSDQVGMIHLQELADPDNLRTLTGHTGQVLALLFSSDGKQLASGGEDETVRIWDVATGQAVRVIRPELRKHTRTFPVSPWVDDRLWVFAWDGTLRLFNTDTGMQLRLIERKELSRLRSFAAVSWDGRQVATGGRDGIVRLFEPETGHDVEALGTSGDAVNAVAFAPDDQTLVSSDTRGKVIVWNLAQRTPRAVLRGQLGTVWPPAFSNDGQRLCTWDGEHKLRIWDITQQPSAVDVCHGHETLVLCVAFSPDGRMLASGGAESGGGMVKLWDVASGQFIRQFEGHSSWVWSVAFSPDGNELASTGVDGTLRLWDLTQHSLRITIDRARESKTWVSYSRDGRQLISSERHGALRVWDRSTGAEIRSAHIGESWAEKPALSPDGRYLVAGLGESIVWLEYPSLKTVRRFPHSPVYGDTIAFSPDSRMIATCDETSNHVYLSSMDGTPLGTLNHRGGVNAVDFSPDGRTLVTGDLNHEVHIWDIERRERRATLHGHDNWIDMVRFSPDGKTIASSGDDGTIRLWRSEPAD